MFSDLNEHQALDMRSSICHITQSIGMCGKPYFFYVGLLVESRGNVDLIRFFPGDISSSCASCCSCSIQIEPVRGYQSFNVVHSNRETATSHYDPLLSRMSPNSGFSSWTIQNRGWLIDPGDANVFELLNVIWHHIAGNKDNVFIKCIFIYKNRTTFISNAT